LYTHQPPPPPTYPLSLHDALPIADRAEREHAEHTHGDVKGHARVRFLELCLEDLSCRRTVRRSGIGFGRGLRPWRRRCLWRGRLLYDQVVADDLKRLRDVGQLGTRDDARVVGLGRGIAFQATLAGRAARVPPRPPLRLFLRLLGLFQRFEEKAHITAAARPPARRAERCGPGSAS